MTDIVRHGVLVPLATEEAFRLFAPGLQSWWPAEYTWSEDVLETIAIEPREGGRCLERGPEGFEADWGRVLAWEPAERLVLRWQIGPGREPVPDPARSSEVAVGFTAEEAATTRVELEHRGFERHGKGAETYREAMDSEQGWPDILDRYAAAANARGDDE